MNEVLDFLLAVAMGVGFSLLLIWLVRRRKKTGANQDDRIL